ncbi:MAG TPA: hypothetical protein VE078_18800 [Thermoanaerobaculia bacterium]|nr:hypothetical protein [Thermoanaerobaculia bacterium]
MRERFGDWGAELSDGDFACALAAAGVLSWIASPAWTAERWVDSLLRSTERELFWRFVERSFRFDPATLVQAWGMFQARRTDGDPIKLFLVNPLERGSALDWVTQQLSLPEVGATVKVVSDRSTRSEPESKGTGSYSLAVDDEPDAQPPTKTGYPVRGDKEPVLPRFLQAQLYDRRSPGVRIRRGLTPGRTYAALIRVGLADRAWLRAERPLPLPRPAPPQGHELTVIFWEPQVSPEPQVQHLLLPPKGNSEPVTFAIEIPEDIDSIAARITVLHANRVLQTGVLRAPVRTDGRWTFGLDAAPRTLLEGLEGRSRFDFALVLNHDDEGKAKMTAASATQAVMIPISESSLTGLTKALSDQISKIAAMPERYETLHSEGTEELLLTLAQKGGGLHRSLSKLFNLGSLDQPEIQGRQPRIHITSALPDSFFPAEFLYRFQVPEDTAKLCKHALTGLAGGACPPDCTSDKSEIVCPLGFWGLCGVIERHSYLGQHEKPSTGFHLRPEPAQLRSELNISGKALLAASDAASSHEKNAVQDLLKKLRERGEAELASSWKEWSARLVNRPTLLVLLPHHKREGSFEILEIGAGNELKSELIQDTKHVRFNDQDKPIVLLMGCDTNLARIAFDNFVTRFMGEGAAIVVSTIATILGRHASRATVRLVELLDEEARKGYSTFGDVMLRLRQSLVAEQTPMALGLTAYGDADWVLTRAE